jgi:hypothetical protein
MKKLLGLSMVALALTAVSAPRASAWCNTHFSVGLNWSYQSGNNSWLWGALRNGPAGPEGSDWAFGPPSLFYGKCGGYGNGYGPGFGPGPAFGAVYGGGPEMIGSAPPPIMNGAPAPSWTAPAPTPGPSKKDEKKDGNEQAGSGRTASYHPVAYPHASYPAVSYPAPSYQPAYQPAYQYAPASYYTPSYYQYGSYYQPEEYYQGW